MDPQRIINEFKRIQSLGWVPNNRADHNDGGAGNTFEDHLGVSENNLKSPDFEEFEVKTRQNLTGSSLMTLFSKKPSSDYGDGYMRETWGVPDAHQPHVKCFRTTLSAAKWSRVYQTHDMKIHVDRENQKVFIYRADLNGNIIDNNVYWSFSDIKNGAKKLNNMFYVDAEVKVIDNKKHFHYVSAIVFTDYIGDQKFIDLVEDGTITYDNRLGVYGSGPKIGKEHNHGGGFRIKPRDTEKLYRNKIEIT